MRVTDYRFSQNQVKFLFYFILLKNEKNQLKKILSKYRKEKEVEKEAFYIQE